MRPVPLHQSLPQGNQTPTATKEYRWDVYRCYRKVNSRATCAGQTTYKAERIEGQVVGIVRFFFARIQRITQESQIQAAMNRKESTQQKAIKGAQPAMGKAAKAVAALEEEAIKALTDENQLDLAIINQLMPKQKAAYEQARQEYERILLENQAEEDRMVAKRLQINKTFAWAAMFDDAYREAKQMIISQIVERVDVGRDYQISVKMKLTVEQCMDSETYQHMEKGVECNGYRFAIHSDENKHITTQIAAQKVYAEGFASTQSDSEIVKVYSHNAF